MTVKEAAAAAAVRVADAAVPVPGVEVFTYSIPPELEARIKPGVRIKVPFKNRDITAYCVAVEKRAVSFKLKPVTEVLDDETVLSPEILKLTGQISSYYGSSWGESIENALPAWVKFGKKAERAMKKISPGETAPYTAKEPFRLTPEQEAALKQMEEEMTADHPRPILLHGVTGSGKSELYIRLIRNVLARGRGALCLVPEIALTEQLKRFFAQQFGEALEILHSKLSDGERFLAWKRLELGMSRIVLGPRSAIFAPVRNLGLIIMDEEHENSYKQETSPRYHAREAARFRAANEKALFVMGSATPSLEAMRLSETEEFRRLELTKRVDDRVMPRVTVIDLKEYISDKNRVVILSPPLAKEIEANLKSGEGTLLLLNRRGFSTHIHCPQCRQVESCTSCHVSLTFHQENGTLLCHYCNYQRKATDACSNCGTPVLRFSGFGTEKVESEVARRFPQARIARLDADTVKKKGSHEEILKEFREKRADILIGTQMIAKGFDFPHVTLVGVILADVGLMLPDFRSSERTFQLMTQVAGRAGRGDKPGRVLVQTHSPEHPSIRFAKDHDYLNFYRHETPERYQHFYPPYAQLVNFIVRGKDEQKTYLAAKELREKLDTALKEETEKLTTCGTSAPPAYPERKTFEISGPAPLPFYKLRGHFRWHVMIKMQPGMNALITCAHETLNKLKKPSTVAFAVDVDPLNIL